MRLERKRWQSEKDPEERARLLVALVDDLADHQKHRETAAKECVSLYEGRRVSDLSPDGYGEAADLGGDDYERLYWNIPRSLCRTVQAKVAGTTKPKVTFVVTDGDWSAKRRAKRMDRFVEAQFHNRQGIYSDVWQLMQAVALDATVFDQNAGVAKVVADFDERKVVYERCKPWEVFFDSRDADRGNPRSIYHRYPVDKDELLARYEGDAEAVGIIEQAKQIDDRDRDAGRRNTDAGEVMVYEAWHLGYTNAKGKRQPGIHVLALSSGELDSDPWERDGFPFVILPWSRELCGAWSQSLIEETRTINDEVNYTIERMREGERVGANAYVSLEEGSVDKKDIESNEIFKILWRQKGSPEPKIVLPSGFGASTLEWLKLNVEKEFSLSGVSEMAATSRKEQGVTAAVAMRTLADMQTERFSVFASAYGEQAFVDLARATVWAVRDLVAEHGDIAVKWPGKEFLQELQWSDVDLPEDMYQIRPYAVSGMKNTPADRLSLAQDFMGAGVIGPDAFARVTQYLDTEGELKRLDRQREWVGKLIDEWLDYEAGDEYESKMPIPWMVLEDALLQVAEEYFGALLEGAPEANLRFFIQWMEACDRELQKKAAKQAQIQAQAQAAAQPQPLPAGPPANGQTGGPMLAPPSMGPPS